MSAPKDRLNIAEFWLAGFCYLVALLVITMYSYGNIKTFGPLIMLPDAIFAIFMGIALVSMGYKYKRLQEIQEKPQIVQFNKRIKYLTGISSIFLIAYLFFGLWKL